MGETMPRTVGSSHRDDLGAKERLNRRGLFPLLDAWKRIIDVSYSKMEQTYDGGCPYTETVAEVKEWAKTSKDGYLLTRVQQAIASGRLVLDQKLGKLKHSNGKAEKDFFEQKKEELTRQEKIKTEKEEATLRTIKRRAKLETELKKERLKKMKLERRIKQKQYIPLNLVQNYFENTFGQYKAKALALPKMAAIQIDPKDPARVERILQPMIENMLKSLVDPSTE